MNSAKHLGSAICVTGTLTRHNASCGVRAPRPQPSGPHRRAFTLLEILLSLALVMLVMVGLNTFIFSMGELWGHRSESRLLELHVRAATRFLDQQLRIATLPPEALASTQPGAAPGTPPVAVEEIRPQNGSSDNLLTFELPAGCRLSTGRASRRCPMSSARCRFAPARDSFCSGTPSSKNIFPMIRPARCSSRPLSPR